MRIDYENPEVVARQNIAPNAGCDIDGIFYDMRNCVYLLNEQADRIKELEAKLAKAVKALEDDMIYGVITHTSRATLAELTKERSDEKGEDRG
jgi:hypothetical protein